MKHATLSKTTFGMAGVRRRVLTSLPLNEACLHLAKDGIHHWLRTLKRQANHEEWNLSASLSFHDLQHDFAHRARDAGWTLEEIVCYLGHVTQKGTPAIQATVRYT